MKQLKYRAPGWYACVSWAFMVSVGMLAYNVVFTLTPPVVIAFMTVALALTAPVSDRAWTFYMRQKRGW